MKNRVINQGYWTDPEYLTWTHEQKYFYLYLITCSHTNLIGVAPLIPEHFALETKLPLETVRELLQFLQDSKKIYMSKRYLFVFALFKYQAFGGKTIDTAVANLLKDVRDPEILHLFEKLYPQYSEHIPDIDDICPIDTLLIPHTYPTDNRDRDRDIGHSTGTNNIYIGSQIEKIRIIWNEHQLSPLPANLTKTNEAISKAINDYTYDSVVTAIKNYSKILHGKGYLLDTKWQLSTFLEKHVEKFLDFESAKDTYNRGGSNGAKGANRTDRTKAHPGAERPDESYYTGGKYGSFFADTEDDENEQAGS